MSEKVQRELDETLWREVLAMLIHRATISGAPFMTPTHLSRVHT